MLSFPILFFKLFTYPANTKYLFISNLLGSGNTLASITKYYSFEELKSSMKKMKLITESDYNRGFESKTDNKLKSIGGMIVMSRASKGSLLRMSWHFSWEMKIKIKIKVVYSI